MLADIIQGLLGDSKEDDLQVIRHLFFPDGYRLFYFDAGVNRFKSPAEPGKGGYDTQVV